MKVADAVRLCWSVAAIVYVPLVDVSAVTIVTNVPDELTETVCGMVIICVFAQVIFIVSDGVKPEPLIVVAKPELGVNVTFCVTATDGVTVKLPVADAICAPLSDAVAVIG